MDAITIRKMVKFLMNASSKRRKTKSVQKTSTKSKRIVNRLSKNKEKIK
jgi:hypothetical protein